MTVNTKEFADMRKQFEKDFSTHFYVSCSNPLERDNSGVNGIFYSNGEVNKLFQAYMFGYSYHKCISNLENS